MNGRWKASVRLLMLELSWLSMCHLIVERLQWWGGSLPFTRYIHYCHDANTSTCRWSSRQDPIIQGWRSRQ
jgi:hypothetical protein